MSNATADDVDVTANTNSGVNLNALAGTTMRIFSGVTVANTGTLQPNNTFAAIYANNRAWTVTNLGTVSSSLGNALTLDAGGTVDNRNQITSSFNAVRMSAGGTVLNAASSTIQGGASAIWISGQAGSLTNAGTITGSATTVTFQNGGTVVNEQGGLIENTNQANAVSIRGGTTRSITNSGTIRDLSGGFAAGAVIQGGTVTNNAGGLITGTYNAIWAITGAATSIVNAGQLTATSAGAIEMQQGGSVENSGTISGAAGIEVLPGFQVVNPSASVINSGTITGTGGTAIRFANGTNSVTLRTGSILNGNVLGGTGIDNLILEGTGSESIAKFSSFQTLTMNGTDWTLTGNGTFSTSATVQGGTLRVNGQLSAVTGVLSGGTLTGTGTVIGNVTNNSGGNVRVDVATTLAFNGNYIHQNGATFIVGLTPTTTGRLNVTGGANTAQLNGGTVRVEAGMGSYAPNTQYTILNAAGGVNGTFTGGVTTNLAFLAPTLSYDANNVYLNLALINTNFAATGQTFNQRSTGGGVQSLGLTSALVNAILPLSADQARSAFDRLSGEIHPSLHSLMLDESALIRDALLGRARQDNALIGGPAAVPYAAFGAASPALAYDAPRSGSTSRLPVWPIKVATPPSNPVYTAWAQGFGNFGRINGDGNAATLRHDTGGGIAGVDLTFANAWRMGLAAGGAQSRARVDERASSGTLDAFHLAAYGGGNVGPLFLRAGAAYSVHDIATLRNVTFPGFSATLSGKYDAVTAQLFGEGAWRVSYGAWRSEAFAELAHVNVHTEAFQETGNTLAALNVAANSTATTFSTLGLRTQTPLPFAPLPVIGRASLGWRHAFNAGAPLSLMSFAGGGVFPVAGVPLAENMLVASAGLETAIRQNIQLSLGYTGRVASEAAAHSVDAKLAMRF